MDKVQSLGDIFSWIVDKNVNITWSDLRISSLQCWFATPTHRSFTPESCRSLLLRSNSLRQEDWELTTEDRSSQLVSVRLQSVSLKIMNAKTNNTVINMYSFWNKESLDLAIFFFCLLMNSDLSIRNLKFLLRSQRHKSTWINLSSSYFFSNNHWQKIKHDLIWP